jgi:hypothetical protein
MLGKVEPRSHEERAAAPPSDDLLAALDQKAGAVLETAAPTVGARVGRADQLGAQVAVAQLVIYAVEPDLFGQQRRRDELLADALDLVGGQIAETRLRLGAGGDAVAGGVRVRPEWVSAPATPTGCCPCSRAPRLVAGGVRLGEHQAAPAPMDVARRGGSKKTMPPCPRPALIASHVVSAGEPSGWLRWSPSVGHQRLGACVRRWGGGEENVEVGHAMAPDAIDVSPWHMAAQSSLAGHAG